MTPNAELPSDPTWYKSAVIYEVRVRSFYDSNGDGIGDFAGLCEKLDYLEDLGVTAIWMLPFSVPAERPVVLTEMVKLAGRLPLVGAAMLSHEFPDATDAVTLAVLAGDDPMFKVCEAGAAASPSV